ncbi:MAG: GyrI-like domain-containing protein [Chloroflexi bacterium]|nr:GyrI-like domain-containing protein [Chloroflexota bacterium]
METPEIRQLDAFTVVGLDAAFFGIESAKANNFEVIPPLWDRFHTRCDEVPNRADASMYGVIVPPAGGGNGKTDEIRYVAGVAVSEVGSLPDGMVRYDLPACDYAVFEHRGPIGNLGMTLDYAFRNWLPNSGYRWSGIELERYDHRYSSDTSDLSIMEFWVGIALKEG